MGGGFAGYYEDMETRPPEDAMNRVFLMGYPLAALAYDRPERDCIECLRRATELRLAHKGDFYASDFPDDWRIGKNTGPQSLWAASRPATGSMPPPASGERAFRSGRSR